MIIDITEDELKDLLVNLFQCEHDGYIEYGDPCYSLLQKLQLIHDEIGKQKSKKLGDNI